MPSNPSTGADSTEAAGPAGDWGVSAAPDEDEQAAAPVMANKTRAAEAATVRKRMKIPLHGR
ncbi:hypothetical protein ACWEQJ_17895 [Streptomyces cyaneofuscatus]